MLLESHEASVALDDRQMLKLIDAQGVMLRATHGTVWVTQDGDPVDRILKAGDSLLIAQGGRTLITAVAGGAAVSASRRQARTWLGFWRQLWRNLRARGTRQSVVVKGELKGALPGALKRSFAPRPARLVHE